MHHEILLALSGCPGDIFTCSRETGLFELISDLPFIHPSEVALVNKVVRLGSYYQSLRQFITEQISAVVTWTTSTQATPPQAVQSSGIYLRALAFGIDKVLDSYRHKLVEVEKQCIVDPHLPLSHIQYQFEEFQSLLPSLDATVKQILRNKIHGCRILTYLHERCSCGNPTVKEAYERILFMTNGVFYKQLSTWMLHGVLKDQFNEFFIEYIPIKEEKDSKETGPKEEEAPGKVVEELSRYRICPALKPSYVPMRAAEKILFIGEAVQIFLDKQVDQITNIKEDTTSQTTSQILSDQLKYTTLLSELQQQNVFNLRIFESVCGQIRDSVAEHLWRLLVEEGDLLGSLQIMKEFYLLGRGELFLTFIDIANSFMTRPPTSVTQHDVNIAFAQAMTKIGIENEELLHHFKLTLPTVEQKRPFSSQLKKEDKAWNHLGLSYTPKWPLHVLFTPTVLEKYNSLFKLLLAVRRAQMALQHTWYLQMSCRQRGRSLWQLRVHMAFLIDNLQYYVQVDVLETQYTQLLEKIRATHDFESIKHAHELFLTALQAQLFFVSPPISRALHEIMELCHHFHSFVQDMGYPLTSHEVTVLDRITKEFQRQSSLLFRILSSVRSIHSAPHLAQLLLRVDYNKFFSSQMLSSTHTMKSST